MSAPGTFTVVNDDALCAAIAATAQTLVYVAPGISKPVVEAIGKSLDCKDHLLATVIVDLDPEVYRMGYGTEEGLRALQALAKQQHLELRQQPGLRVGLLYLGLPYSFIELPFSEKIRIKNSPSSFGSNSLHRE